MMNDRMLEIDSTLKRLFDGSSVIRLRPSEVWPILESQFGVISGDERALLIHNVGVYLTEDRHFVRFLSAIEVSETFIGNSEIVSESTFWKLMSAIGLSPIDEEDKVRLILLLGMTRDTKGNIIIVTEAYPSGVV